MSEHQLQAQDEKGPVRWLALFLMSVASITLFILMAITCVDVAGRYFFNSPLTGSTEFTEFAMAILIFTTLPVVSWRNEHVVVDMLDSVITGTIAKVRTIIVHVLSAFALVWLGQRIHVLGNRSLEYGELTEYLHFPPGYIILYMSYMCWFTSVVLLTYSIYRVIRTPKHPT